MSNNKLAEALGIRFCMTCGEEITNVETYGVEIGYIMHDTQGFYHIGKTETPNNWKEKISFNHEAYKA